MNVKLEQLEKNIGQLTIEVDAGTFNDAMQQSYEKNKNNFIVKGFRKGKAPRNLIIRQYGENVLYDDAINIACTDAYYKAIEEQNIIPITRPEINVTQIGLGKSLIFTAKITIKPTVILGEYKNIFIEHQEVIVTDEDVENAVQKVIEQQARLINVVDRPAQKGDTVIIDFEGFVDNVIFEGGKTENYSLVIGDNKFVAGFEDQLIDKNIDDEFDINITFPEDYTNSDLAGKIANFKVKINAIKTKEYPIVDDEFAQDVSEFDTLEEYKTNLKITLIKQKEQQANNQYQEDIIQQVVDNAQVDIPDIMIDNRVNVLIKDFDDKITTQGLDLKQYKEMTKIDDDTFRERFKERAIEDVKTQLVLEQIGTEENIEVTKEELEDKLKIMAEHYNQTEIDFKANLKQNNLNAIHKSIMINKVIEFLVGNVSSVPI
jgi:trigger factor